MSPTQSCVVALRLLSMWLLVDSVMSFYQGVTAYDDREYWGYLGWASAMLCGAAIAYRYPLQIANALLRSVPDAASHSTTPDEWFAVGCSLLGLWFSAKAIPAICANLFFIAATHPGTQPHLAAEETAVDRLKYYGIQLCLGIFLVLGRKALWRVIGKARGL
jgi:hypothetical protein